jgi:hypothetical protein
MSDFNPIDLRRCLARAARRAFLCLLIMLIWSTLCAGPMQSESIRVRLIDPRSGKPQRKVEIIMTAWNGKPTHTPDTSIATTGQGGDATFLLSQPLPEHVAFGPPPTDFVGCSGAATFSPQKIIQEGAVATYDTRCGKLNWRGAASPGEVIIFARKLSLWDKILRELP